MKFFPSPLRRSLLLVSVMLLGLIGSWAQAFAASGDLFVTGESVWLSDSTIVHNQTVKIYAQIGNNSTSSDLLGSVQFINQTTGEQIGSDQAVSVTAGGTDTVFVDWTPTAGTYSVGVIVYPWDKTGDDGNNNSTSFTITVDYDSDSDLIGNSQDPDDDNDGVPDTEDAFPYDSNESKDTDGDGTGDNADTDDDNDGIEDATDGMPEDPNESEDTDGDGTGNNADDDDDNDGLTDSEEEITDPYNSDTDGDSYLDGEDAFPTDEEEWKDTDEDGEGNNADEDDDNDGLADTDDEYPENHGPVVELVQYDEVDEETGESVRVFDASSSYDPDGDSTSLIYQWFTEDGQLISSEAILRLPINKETAYPSLLIITDDVGESRNLEINLFGALRYLGAMTWALFISLLVALAIIAYFKYTATASRKKQVKSTPSSDSKQAPKATSKKKVTPKKSSKRPKKR